MTESGYLYNVTLLIIGHIRDPHLRGAPSQRFKRLTCSLFAACADVLASILLRVPRGEGGTPAEGAELLELEGAFVCAFTPLIND